MDEETLLAGKPEYLYKSNRKGERAQAEGKALITNVEQVVEII